MSTLTVFTPSIFPTAPSMACWQCSQEMSGATRVVVSIVFAPLFVFVIIALLIPCNGIELDQLLNDRFLSVTFHALRHAGAQMPLQDNCFQFLQRFAYGISLT